MTPDMFQDIEALIVIAALLAALLNRKTLGASPRSGKDRGKIGFF